MESNNQHQVNKPFRFAQAHSGLNNQVREVIQVNNQVIQIIQRVEQYLMELNKMTTNLYLSLSILEKVEISNEMENKYKKEIVEAIAPMASRVATRVKIEKKF